LSEPIITAVKAIEIIDNRAMPTVRAYACVDNAHWGWADVPCGSSTGSYEARELRDGGRRYHGKGVRRAIENIHAFLAPGLQGLGAADQHAIDNAMLEMDGTRDKSRLGANAILGVSLAVARAAALAAGKPLFHHLNRQGSVLPVPQACLINGGMHAGNDLDIQEYCVMPVGADSFSQAVRMLSEIFMVLKDQLESKLGRSAINSSEDGGFAPPFDTSEQALDVLLEAVAAAGYGDSVVLGLDLAATGFFEPASGQYTFEGRSLSPQEMREYVENLVKQFPAVVSIEDPLMEDDFDGFARLTEVLPDVMVIGDDIFATNKGRIEQGYAAKAANAVLCKVNQIGTLSEAMDTAQFAREKGYGVVVSERSGETEDAILADISVALNAGLFKTGGMRGSDRGAKYNRFMEIELELGRDACYAGRDFRAPDLQRTGSVSSKE